MARPLRKPGPVRTRLLVVLDKPNSKEARIEPALLSEDKATSDNSKLLKPYRLCHVDVTTEYGQKVAKAFNAKEFPHVAIIDKTGSMVIFNKTGQIDSGRVAEDPYEPQVGRAAAQLVLSKLPALQDLVRAAADSRG